MMSTITLLTAASNIFRGMHSRKRKTLEAEHVKRVIQVCAMHDCCNCRQRTRGRPSKQLKLQLASAPAMSTGIVAESVVTWSICTVHPAVPAAADTVLSPATVLLFLQLSPLLFLQLSLFQLMSHDVVLIMVAGTAYSKY